MTRTPVGRVSNTELTDAARLPRACKCQGADLTMRKSQIRIFAFLFVLLTTTAQPSRAQFGVKGGLSVSGIDGDDYTTLLGYEVQWLQNKDGYVHLSFQIGGFYRHRLARHFALQPEVHLIRRGLDFYHTPLYDTSLRAKIYYLQVPLLLRYRFLLAGPYVAVKLSGRRTLTVRGESDSRGLPCVSPVDYGITFALNPEFSIRSRRMFVELRADFGLANITDQTSDVTELYLGSSRMRVLSLALLTGIRF